MSTEIIYKNYVVESNGRYRPFSIIGNSNTFDYEGRIVKTNVDILKTMGISGYLTKSELEPILAKDYDAMINSGVGVYRGLQKTKKGYINSFFKTPITPEQLKESGKGMEFFFKNVYVNKAPVNQIIPFKHTVFKGFSNEVIEKGSEFDLINQRIFAYEKMQGTYKDYKDGDLIPMGEGTIKALKGHGENKYGFFKLRARRYTPLEYIAAYQIIKK